MPIPEEEVAAAAARQTSAARAESPQVRVVAGPGTGKSSCIEDRVYWLMVEKGIPPRQIFAISFTRASTADLRSRIDLYCASAGVDAADVNVSTVHSLALRLLRRADLLARFPARPSVLDEWELDEIFDAEFADTYGLTPTRCEKIRRYHEAIWSTGRTDPPNYIPPDPPIAEEEINRFDAFHRPSTETYACVLPGELVRECVQQIDAGLLAPRELIEVSQLIVDEYQDLNPYDQLFIERLTQAGVPTFLAGDDDQSIYSFRFASPAGIQDYPAAHPDCASHTLDSSFRSTPRIMAAARRLIEAFPSPGRIEKNLQSLYVRATPEVPGVLIPIQYADDRQEAKAIAESCRALIEAGIPARQIQILLSNRDLQAAQIQAALLRAGVPHEMPTADRLVDEIEGRALLSLVRIACESNDYVAHRTLLGLPRGIGVRTCRQIAETVIRDGRNYRDVFYGLAPLEGFSSKQRQAIEKVAGLVAEMVGWSGEDLLEDRRDGLVELIAAHVGGSAEAVGDFLSELPGEITLNELRDYLWADKDETQAQILLKVHQRAGREIAAADVLPARVRVMTMHGAKGLSAQVVFIPGLEDQVLPGEKRRRYPGLVLEAARLLYVSITRARAACILSYSTHRVVFGKRENHRPSQYLARIGERFVYRGTGLTTDEVGDIMENIKLL